MFILLFNVWSDASGNNAGVHPIITGYVVQLRTAIQSRSERQSGFAQSLDIAMNPLHSQFSMGMKKKYQTKGLYVIGIHSPESEREKERTHVMKAVKRYHVDYSIMMDNDLRY